MNHKTQNPESWKHWLDRTTDEIASKTGSEQVVKERIDAHTSGEWDPAEAIIVDQLNRDYDNTVRELMGLGGNANAEDFLPEEDLKVYHAYMSPRVKNETIKATLMAIERSGQDLDDIKPEQVKNALETYINAQRN